MMLVHKYDCYDLVYSLQFDSTEFMNNLNMQTMELNMNCDCVDAARGLPY